MRWDSGRVGCVASSQLQGSSLFLSPGYDLSGISNVLPMMWRFFLGSQRWTGWWTGYSMFNCPGCGVCTVYSCHIPTVPWMDSGSTLTRIQFLLEMNDWQFLWWWFSFILLLFTYLSRFRYFSAQSSGWLMKCECCFSEQEPGPRPLENGGLGFTSADVRCGPRQVCKLSALSAVHWVTSSVQIVTVLPVWTLWSQRKECYGY